MASTKPIGVHSARIGTRLQEEPSYAFDLTKAHWVERLRERGEERWLRVTPTDSVETAAKTIVDAINGLLPYLLAHATDEALRDEWLQGSAPGLTNLQRLLYTSILVNEIGPSDRLGQVVAELRGVVAGTVHEGLVEGRLARAGVRVA